MKPQTAACLRLLRSHPEGVTALDALDDVGSFRLGARIYELRVAGYKIATVWVDTTSGARIASYRLLEPAGQLEAFR